MTRRTLLAALIALVIGAPTEAAGADSLTVLAASSLTDALSRAGAAWTAKGHAEISFSFDGSSRLAKQVEAGIPADAFFSADRDWMDYLQERGLVEASTRVDLLGNTLVLVEPAAMPASVREPSDLLRPALVHLALAGESVPAGKYGRAALRAAGVWEAVEARVVQGDNVRTVLSWVASGNAEAGVVYATDAKVEPKVRVAFTFPPSSHPPIVYPAAVLKGAQNAQAAADFLAFCRSPEGMAIFTAAGFVAAPVAP